MRTHLLLLIGLVALGAWNTAPSSEDAPEHMVDVALETVDVVDAAVVEAEPLASCSAGPTNDWAVFIITIYSPDHYRCDRGGSMCCPGFPCGSVSEG